MKAKRYDRADWLEHARARALSAELPTPAQADAIALFFIGQLPAKALSRRTRRGSMSFSTPAQGLSTDAAWADMRSAA